MDLRGAGEFAFANARHSPKGLRNDEKIESQVCDIMDCHEAKASRNDEKQHAKVSNDEKIESNFMLDYGLLRANPRNDAVVESQVCKLQIVSDSMESLR